MIQEYVTDKGCCVCGKVVKGVSHKNSVVYCSRECMNLGSNQVQKTNIYINEYGLRGDMFEKISSLFKPKEDGSYEMSIISYGDCGVTYNYAEELNGGKK